MLAYASIEQALFAARWSRCAQLCNIAKVDMSSTVRFHGPGIIKGKIAMPGDKSISHRVAMLASLAEGNSVIDGFASSVDCAATLDCVTRLGIEVERENSRVVIHGRGSRGYRYREDPIVLDAGNSGSTMRMLTGLLASRKLETVFDGDNSLRRRPMRRIIEPLTRMGARIDAVQDNFPPLKISGTTLQGIDYQSPIASAQVKTAVLFAGLSAEGAAAFGEPILSRNHTELMLPEFGARFSESLDGPGHQLRIQGGQELKPVRYTVPGDPSSAAFFCAAAAATPGSRLVVQNVNLNPTRIAFVEALQMLGADIVVDNAALAHGEKIGDLIVTGRSLMSAPGGCRFPREMIPALIDEIPVLAVIATQVEGRVEIRHAEELRVKESDRIKSVAAGLRALGAEVEEFEDGLAVSGPQRLIGGVVESAGDHRIAMAFSIAGLLARGVTEIRGAECAAVSFPQFFETLASVSNEGVIEKISGEIR